jgi:hypothetical protein
MAEAAADENLRVYEQESAAHLEAVPARDHYNVEFFEVRATQLIDGRKNVEHDNWSGEQKLNGRTALWEALTAKGHLSRVVFEGDREQINKGILQRLLNAHSDNLPEWEKDQRFYEIVEELLVQQVESDVIAGLLPADVKVLTISDRPKQATGELAVQIGYRELNDKGIVRTHGFEWDEQGQLRRVLEQISRSNSNDGSSEIMLQSMGAELDGSSLKRLSNHILISGEAFPNGVVDLQRVLDSHSGPHTRYGEDSRADDFNCPDYTELRKVSRAREEHFSKFSQRLAIKEIELNVQYKVGLMSYEQKLALLTIEREKIINEICLIDPSYAKDARGELSAKYFRKANASMVAGDNISGQQHFASAINSVDSRAAVICGGTGVEAGKVVLDVEGRKMYQNAKEARENWQWTKGHCAINNCPTRPGKAEVGPCRVCRSCQQLFDKGMDVKDIRHKYDKLPARALKFSAFEIFVNSVRAQSVTSRIKRLSRRAQASENEWQQRRLQNEIQRESAELEQLQQVA